MENMCLKCLENSYGCTADHLTNRLEIHRLQTNIVGLSKSWPDSFPKWDTWEPDPIYGFDMEKSKSPAFWSDWTPAALMWLC